MQIDWITVAAQIVNFLILVWLLHRFLYGPIIRAMDRREQRIADRLREAANKGDEAEQEARRYREKQEELESRRDQLMAQAREEAEEERKTLENEAREEVEARKREWLQQLRSQRESFLQDIRREVTERFQRLSRRALGELADAELESRMAKVLVDRLEDLDAETRRKIAEACEDAGGRVIVRSRFGLSANDRRQITRAIHDRISADADVDYRESGDIACGIELRAGSKTVSWSLDSYFESLESALNEEIGRAAGEPEKQAAQ